MARPEYSGLADPGGAARCRARVHGGARQHAQRVRVVLHAALERDGPVADDHDGQRSQPARRCGSGGLDDVCQLRGQPPAPPPDGVRRVSHRRGQPERGAPDPRDRVSRSLPRLDSRFWRECAAPGGPRHAPRSRVRGRRVARGHSRALRHRPGKCRRGRGPRCLRQKQLL